ncbi:hypothetical protein [Ralstonia sp. 24A2]|uniref:hypothetical protein n=1 Tax=Ralstonia sp. 24A2 TaxID=3447364 RepID=UPI003F69811F
MTSITPLQAQTQLDVWIAANVAFAPDQSYITGGRSLTGVNAAAILDQIELLGTECDALGEAASVFDTLSRTAKASTKARRSGQ